MAFRYLIYSTGTTYAETIVRESATDNPAAFETSLFSDFVIPEIQPLYLWRVTGGVSVVPNTDANINNYLESIAPPPEPEDDASVGFVTGITSQKIDIVTGATGNIGTFVTDGNLEDSGYAISDLTGGTSYNFIGSGGTQIFENGTNPVNVTIYSAPPTGSSVAWGDITGTLSNQTDLQNALDAKTDNSTFNTYTGDTDIRIDAIETVTDIALTGATNGLVTNGRNVELGGTLTRDTLISGTTFDFTVNTQTIKIQAVNGIDIIDTDGIGGINIESDAGTIALVGNTNLSAEQTKLEISETQMLITDSRTGATRVGLEYAGDYSTTFTNESLITKRYADTIAGGLIPKAATLVATTGESINLIAGGLITVDGITLSNGDRVLVKDQTTASENGIYIASASTWVRSDDFDGNPDGEVSAGNIIPVTSGATQYSSLWVLVTPNPIIVDTTDLEFSLFSSPHEMIAGTGIDITGNVISVDGASLAGNSITWTGDTFNVDITTGTLSTALDSKLNITDFNIYTGATDTRLNTIESEITYISGVTDTKLDTTVFDTYTGATTSNEIFLTHSGGTELNTIAPTAIEWDIAEVSGSSFLWSGGSDIYIEDTAVYEINYNIPFNAASQKNNSIGANLILNNSTVIDISAAADFVAVTNGAGSVGLPTIILSLTSGDKLTLATFRTGASGSVISSLTGSILIKKKNTLQ